MNRMTKAVLAGAAAGALGIGAGVAYAAWSSTGTGSGTAKTGSDVSSTISASAAAPADLYPGAVKTLDVVINNPNPYPVIVTGISSSSSPLQAGCAAASVTTDARTDATGLSQAGGAKPIAPGGTGTYTLTSRMISNPSDACKAQTFTMPLTATLLSAAS